MLRSSKCDSCNKTLEHKEIVSVIIDNVEVDRKINKADVMHLKVSKNSIDSRAVRVYCQECLQLNNYINEEVT